MLSKFLLDETIKHWKARPRSYSFLDLNIFECQTLNSNPKQFYHVSACLVLSWPPVSLPAELLRYLFFLFLSAENAIQAEDWKSAVWSGERRPATVASHHIMGSALNWGFYCRRLLPKSRLLRDAGINNPKGLRDKEANKTHFLFSKVRSKLRFRLSGLLSRRLSDAKTKIIFEIHYWILKGQ